MTAHRGRFVAYYRVSTDKQGKSGLALDAQQEAINARLNGGGRLSESLPRSKAVDGQSGRSLPLR
jgi:hypothetical protein